MRIFIWLLLAQAAPSPERRPDSGVAVTLSDGSTLISSGTDDALQVRTAYGDQRIPIREIRTARRLPHGSFVIQARGLALTGDVVPKEIDVNTTLGSFRVQTDDIRSLNASCGGRNLADDSTVGLWWFPDTDDNTCRDRVKNRPFLLQDFGRVDDPVGTPSIVRKKFNGLLSAACDEDVDLVNEDFTIEVRFRLPAQISRAVMILQKGNPIDGMQDLNITTSNNYSVQVYCLNTGNSHASQPNVLKREGWNTVTIVQKKEPAQALIYVNGRQVANSPQQMSFGSGDKRPLHLGVHPRLASGYEAPEAFQCLRISKIARSAEEIAAMEQGWEFAASVVPSARGALLRDGSCLKAELPGVGGATFRTRFGALTLSEKIGGQIRLYPQRPKDLELVRVGARELIGKLGSGRVEERDAATVKLTALGEMALPVLRESEDSADPETRCRVGAILKKLAETGVAKRPACDVLLLGDILLHGWLDLDQIVLATRRGTHRLPASQVETINLGRRDWRVKPMLHLMSGEIVEFSPAEGAKLVMETDFGSMNVPLEELRGLSFDGAKKRWTLAVDRMAAAGRISGEAMLETPIGPLTLPLAEVRELRHPGRSPAAVAPGDNE